MYPGMYEIQIFMVLSSDQGSFFLWKTTSFKGVIQVIRAERAETKIRWFGAPGGGYVTSKGIPDRNPNHRGAS